MVSSLCVCLQIGSGVDVGIGVGIGVGVSITMGVSTTSTTSVSWQSASAHSPLSRVPTQTPKSPTMMIALTATVLSILIYLVWFGAGVSETHKPYPRMIHLGGRRHNLILPPECVSLLRSAQT